MLSPRMCLLPYIENRNGKIAPKYFGGIFGIVALQLKSFMAIRRKR